MFRSDDYWVPKWTRGPKAIDAGFLRSLEPIYDWSTDLMYGVCRIAFPHTSPGSPNF